MNKVTYKMVSTSKGQFANIMLIDGVEVSHTIIHANKEFLFKIGKTKGDTRKLNGLTRNLTEMYLNKLGYDIVWSGDVPTLQQINMQ